MTPPDPPELLIQLCPPKVFAKGREGIRTVGTAAQALLYAMIVVRVGWLVLLGYLMLC